MYIAKEIPYIKFSLLSRNGNMFFTWKGNRKTEISIDAVQDRTYKL
jgi:hypothetical protein